MSEKRVAIVTGGSSGLGKAVITAMLENQSFTNIINWSLDTGVDIRSEAYVERAVQNAVAQFGKIDVLVQCAGINHIEFIPNLLTADWDNIVNTNARGLWLTVKHLAEHMIGGSVCNIVSNASHMPMTSSAAYNASKGAAAILTKQMSRELIKTHDITCFAVSPNKLSGTGMSDYIDNKVCELRGWTKEEARNYQLASLPAGEETNTNTLAEFIAFLLSSKQRHKYLAGCDIQYGL
jgi:NAD(P)-dependent dehydrogenase (short-subunit alcohol dehydrogenase family)